MEPLQELVSLAKQSGSAGTSHTLRELSSNDKRTLHRILSENPHLLFSEYEDCDTVWRWLIKHDYFLIIKFVLNMANEGKYGTGWPIPSNQYDKKNGSTIFTDHTLYLTTKLFHLLFAKSGEKLHLYNKTTNETVLHILVKKNTIQGKETAFDILKNIVAENSMDLDPDLIDFAGKTALHYALERGELGVAELLVERIGADWDLGMKSALSVSNETLASRHPECVKFLQKCRENYSIKPNSEGGGETCVICLNEIEASAYAMRCCSVKLHTTCLRKHLARAEALSCLICRQEICKDLYNSVPSTIFKSKWEKEMAQRHAATASVVTSDATDTGGFVNITPDQDFRFSPRQQDINLHLQPHPPVIIGSSLIREHNSSSTTSEEENNHLYEEIVIMENFSDNPEERLLSQSRSDDERSAVPLCQSPPPI